jgi:hypothetical protein
MDSIELFPNLSHCIETTARKEFWNSVNQYLEGGCQDRHLEEKIELLRAFLESADFKKLRGQSEHHLVQGQTVKFVITRQADKVTCEMVVSKG